MSQCSGYRAVGVAKNEQGRDGLVKLDMTGYMSNRPEISQEAAYALLSAIKAVIEDMVCTSGSTYTFDSSKS